MAKELEEIHLGAYDDCISSKKEDFFEAISLRSRFVHNLSLESDKLLLKEQAEKRWARVMLQGGTNVGWAEEQVVRVRQGKMVFATPEADAASRSCDLVGGFLQYKFFLIACNDNG
jgi:hypothetical protein